MLVPQSAIFSISAVLWDKSEYFAPFYLAGPWSHKSENFEVAKIREDPICVIKLLFFSLYLKFDDLS